MVLHTDPYKGTARKLVLAIDVGTTFSGVAYCVLDPGEVPKVISVTRFPGQEGESHARDVKIPTALYYDRDEKVRAVGAEASLEAIKQQALEEEWTYVKWFKLHLRPSSILPGATLAPIDVKKSAIEICADFLTYLVKCAKDFISETHPIGKQVLSSGAPIDFVLSHPNGWLGPEQSNLRRAAILAEMIPDTVEGHAQLHFVTEGEASMHFCIANGLSDDVIKPDNVIAIADLGGGTIDLSTYRVLQSAPFSAQESIGPVSLIQGSVIVNRRAEEYLRNKLKGSRFTTDDDISAMMEYFDGTTKPTFRDPAAKAYIRFGGPRDTDANYGIKRGVLTLPGTDIGSFFQDSLDAIKSGLDVQLAGTSPNLATVLLVGGFATSPYLHTKLQEYATSKGVRMFYPDGQTSKAVAEGALWFHLDNCVCARVARHTYGSGVNPWYDESDPEHVRRKEKTYTELNGNVAVPGGFATIVSKGTSVHETKEFSFVYGSYYAKPENMSLSAAVMAYRGSVATPKWMDEEPDSFYTLCWVKAEPPQGSWQKYDGPKGPYLTQDYDVIIQVGLTEMKAQIGWWENGVHKRAAATVVYDNAP